MRENDPVLSVEGLSYAYEEGRPVLQDVSFSVPKGAYVSVIGHNGSGKSTLAKCIMGLLGGFEGKISLFGEELTRKSLYRLRSRVGIVFQNPDNQFVGSTVADDIAFGLENKQIPQAEMQAIIEEVAESAGMKKFLGHEPQNLSGGQKQRVAIAGVLAMNPDLVIFDEATAMLDPKGKREIRDLIASMRKKNPQLTILSITHDVEEAAISDKVLVINEGEVFAYGKPEDVFSDVDALKSIRLDAPFAYVLANLLRKNGMKIEKGKMSLETLEDIVCR
jgi:energy-coupling factor transport system ATP-binding protein